MGDPRIGMGFAPFSRGAEQCLDRDYPCARSATVEAIRGRHVETQDRHQPRGERDGRRGSASMAVRLKSSPVKAKKPTVLVTSSISVAIALTANGHLIEAVMIASHGTQGYSFVSSARRLMRHHAGQKRKKAPPGRSRSGAQVQGGKAQGGHRPSAWLTDGL